MKAAIGTFLTWTTMTLFLMVNNSMKGGDAT